MATTTFFAAQVINSNAGTRAITVIAESNAGGNSPHAGYMQQAVPVTSILSHFLGFSDCSLPQPGTRVLCVADSGDLCYILGAIPQETLGVKNIPARALLGAGYARADEAQCKGHEKYTPHVFDNRRPQDIVDGEYVVANEFGVLLGLFQQLAVLKASDLAQVQCFLLDDLVRVISHNYQHYTALGEYNIYHDGKRIMAEFGATHKPAETYGQPAVNSDEGAGKTFSEGGQPDIKDASDFYDIDDDERIRAIERLKIVVGSVGDFLHMFLARPDPNAKRYLNGNPGGRDDTGLCDFHIGTDGGLHLRSVKEVFIEKTNWIRIPNRKRAPEDPQGDDAETLEYQHKAKFAFNDSYSYVGNPFSYGLQIRDYVSFVNEKLNYQNYKAHTQDFKVSDSIGESDPISTINKIDKETDLHLQSYKLTTAGIYLMPNGGVTIRDAWSSAIVMEGGNIYIQPAKDLISQPLRNNIVKAGGNISMCAKKHVDLSSTKEGIRIKAEKAQYIYSNTGGIVIESKSTRDVPYIPDPDSAALEYTGGVVLKSNLGIYSYANTNILQYAKKKILFQAIGNVDIVSDKTLTAYGKKYLQLFSDKTMFIHAQKDIDVYANGKVLVAGVAKTALGQKDQKLAVMYDPNSKAPFRLIYGVLDPAAANPAAEANKKFREELLKQTIWQTEEELERLKFRFLETDQYGGLNSNQDHIPATLAQQDNLLTNLYSLSPWIEVEVNGTLPYPGKSLWPDFYLDTQPLNNLEKSGIVGEDLNNIAEATPTPPSLTLVSLDLYKVQS